MATSYLTVPTPARQSTRGGLLSVANVIESDDGHLLQGVTYVGDGCNIPLVTPGSCWVTGGPTPATEKNFDGIDDPVSSPLSFVLHAGVECFIGPDEDFADRAARTLEGGESVAVEKVFKSQLLDPAASIGTETSIKDGVARAEQWLSANYPALGLIHLDRRQATLAIEGGGIEADDNYRLQTKQGTPVANGGGYGASNGAGTDPFLLFATGQVNIWRSPIIRVGAVNHTQNTQIALVERHYAITIDCDVIAKITVDLP